MTRMLTASLIALATTLYACGDPDETGTLDTEETDTEEQGDGTEVTMETSMGTLVIQLDPEHAPVTVANFQTYVDEGFYDGTDGGGATLFHRVIADFMIQGGGVTEGGQQKATRDPIVLESDNGLSNLRGTIAMARTSVPDSATSQFFINHVDNTFLDYSTSNDGYAVFGEVVTGMDVVDAIATTPTDASDRPTTDVVITSVTRR